MKIDCPHCGVHGSVDDSLAGKKLRCPKCSKVFLVTEEILPEADDNSMVDQETLSTDESQYLESVEPAAEPEEEVPAEEREGSEDAEKNSEGIQRLEPCSVCNKFFAPEFLVEVESNLYCALCQPEVEEEGLELLEESMDAEDVPEDELLDIVGEDSSDDGAAESIELETCSGCGELLHPDFLETVGSERFCALCIPEEAENESEADLERDETEDSAVAQDEEQLEEKADSVQAFMSDEADEETFTKEPCSVCGEKFHRDFMQEIDSKLYCGVCQPEVLEVLIDDKKEVAVNSKVADAVETADVDSEPDGDDLGSIPEFTVGELIKEAWQKTKGSKGPIWGGLIVMYLIIFAMTFGGMSAFQTFYKGTDSIMVMGVNGALQIVSSWLSMLMTGGIMLIGVRRVLEQRVSWKMVFAGFSKALSITIALVLQSILIIIGFVLLILPGIYLTVGYALTLPLILDKGMGPWEALEASRKAIHKKWWTVFGLYLVMLLLYVVSAIPLGLGLIWTIPMFFVLVGVLYVRLFASDAIVDEEMEDEIVEDDVEEDAEDDEESDNEKEEEREQSSEAIEETK